MKKNLLANYIGTIWNIISTLIFLPFYLKYLGEEKYGIVMLGTTIQALMFLMEGGFAAVMRRQLAWGQKDNAFVSKSVSLLKTIERFYGIIAVVTFIVLTILIDSISKILVKSEYLDQNELNNSVLLISVISMLLMFSGLYNGSLLSLNKHVVSNVFQIAFGLFKNGFVILLIAYEPSLFNFFIYQLLVTILYIFIQRKYLLIEIMSFSSEPNTLVINPNLRLFKASFSTSSLFLLLSVLSTINFQIDKLLISNLLVVENLGYYATAFTIGQLLVSISGPIASSISPALINAFSINNLELTKTLFHRYSKFVTIITTTIGVTLFFNSKLILNIWLSNDQFTNSILHLIPYFIIAGIFLSSQIIPFAIAIASLELKPALLMSIINIIITVPLYYICIKKFGLKGAAIIWMISNIWMAIINNYLYLRKLIPNNYIKWLINDVFIPVVIICLIGCSIYILIPDLGSNWANLISIGVCSLTIVGLGFFIWFKDDVIRQIKLLI